MTFLEKLRVLIFAHQNRVRSMFFEFLYIVEGGNDPCVNGNLRVVCPQSYFLGRYFFTAEEFDSNHHPRMDFL